MTAVIAVAVTGAVCCQRNTRNIEPYGWEKVDSEFDSMTLAAERMIMEIDPADSLEKTADAMLRYADLHPEKKVLRSRALYFKGQSLYNAGYTDEGDSLKRLALALTDSARYPFDAHLIRYFLDNDYHEPSVERYNHLRDETEFFLKSGDKPWTASLAMETGMFLADIGDTRHGEEYLDIADSLLLAGGFKREYSANRINHANILKLRKDTTGAVALMKKTLADTINPVPEPARHHLLGNIYDLTADTAMLHEAYNMVTGFNNQEDFVFGYASELANVKIDAGDLDSARYYLNVARSLSDVSVPQEMTLSYYDALQKYYHALGSNDSAYLYLSRKHELSRQMANEVTRSEINNITLYSKIDKLKLESEMARSRMLVTLLCVIFTLLAAAAAAGWVIARKMQRQKMKTLEATLSRERSGRKALAMETVVTEKENMLARVESEMHQMLADGEISEKAAKKIEVGLRAHGSQKDHREAFVETFENISPDFIRNLKEKFPSLTESDIRLASYISMGIENKHIAQIMSIRSESVKQARWRLRGKLGLKGGESLEDAIRALMH